VEFEGYVIWPEEKELGDAGVIEAIRSVRRLVDFDGTITLPGKLEGRGRIRGRLLEDFLAEEPYVVQTWNPLAAVLFFTEQRPELAKPLLILITPMLDVMDGGRLVAVGKDFAPFGISGVDIFDDMLPEHIRAPGCAILPP